jgi:hypothetical protein
MFLPRLIGIVPLGIGLTVIGFLWLTPFNDFHSPPLFFRIFGSFVALMFVIVGGTLVFGKMKTPGQRMAEMTKDLRELQRSVEVDETRGPGTAFACPNCGASLGEKADVSPNGDVKCQHCNRWFNTHRGAV